MQARIDVGSELQRYEFALIDQALSAKRQQTLVLGQRLNVSTHGILGYAVLSSANLGKALQFALKYYRVLGLSFELELGEQGEDVELRAVESFPMVPQSRFTAEGLLASIHTIARFLLGEELQGLAVGFAHPAP